MMGIFSSPVQNRSSPSFLRHLRTILRSFSTVLWGKELASWNLIALVLPSLSGSLRRAPLVMDVVTPEAVRWGGMGLHRSKGTSHRQHPASTLRHAGFT